MFKDFNSWVSLGHPPLTLNLSPKELERFFYERIADEETFLEWYKQQDLPTYERPSVTVDLVAMTYSKVHGICLLMIKRAANPYRDHLAFAGGFIDPTESAEEACLREVKEELNLDLDSSRLVPLKPRTNPNRDPRGWVLSFPFLVYLTEEEFNQAKAGDDAKDVRRLYLTTWIENFYTGLVENETHKFAFDHREVLIDTFDYLKYLSHTDPSFLKMLGAFTLAEASYLTNVFAQKPLTVQNHFLSKFGDFLEEVGTEKGKGRPARVFKYKNS